MSRTPRFRLLNERWVECDNDTDLFVQVLRALHWRAPELFAKLREHLETSARTYFASSPRELFPKTPSLADNPGHYRWVVPGCYADTNNNSESKLGILVQACAIAGLQLGRDLEIILRCRDMTKEKIDALLARFKALAKRTRPNAGSGAASAGPQVAIELVGTRDKD